MSLPRDPGPLNPKSVVPHASESASPSRPIPSGPGTPDAVVSHLDPERAVLDARRHRDRVMRDSRPASSSRFPRRPTTSRDRRGPGPLSGVDAERRSWACHRAQTVFRRTAADDSANSSAGRGVTKPRSRHRAIAKPSDSGERDAKETGGTTKRGPVDRHVTHRRGLDLQRERLPQRPALPRRRKAAREPQSGREQSTGSDDAIVSGD